MVVTIMGEATPNPPILTSVHQAQMDHHLLLILSGQPALGTLLSPWTQTTTAASIAIKK